MDDYGASFELWDRPLRDHLAANLLPSEEESRFRPTYELGQLVAFGLFGADYRGHHALRLLLKVLAFAALLGVAFRRLEGAAGAALPAPLRWVTAAFAFALFFYFPNNPEARLTPQELPTVACFLGCLFFLDRREEKDRPLRDDLLALGCFALGLWSKEPNVIPGAVLLYAALAATARGRTRAVSSLRIAYVVLWAHAVMKDAVIMALGGYGRPHLGPAEVAAMAREIPRQVLLGATAPWLPGLFAIGLAAFVWLGARRAATRPARRHSLVLLALALAFVAQYLLLPGPVLRYAYPAAAMVVLLTVIGFGLLLAASPSERGRRRRELALAALALAFALACYRDMTAQFATQYVAGWTETAMLERVERLRAGDPGAGFFVVSESEYDTRVGIYFNRHLPYFTGRHARMGLRSAAALVPRGAYWVTRREGAEGFETVLAVPPAPQPRVMAVSTELSRVARLGPMAPEPMLDAGAPAFVPAPWFVLRRTAAEAPQRR